MTDNGIFLSSTTLATLSSKARNEVLVAAGIFAPAAVDQAVGKLGDATEDEGGDSGDGPVELTIAMVRKLTAGLGDKTLSALKAIAKSETNVFNMKDVIEQTIDAANYMDMRGVWSALTRRTRKISDDSTVDLIWWMGASILDDEGDYVDHVGKVSTMTHNSLRTHFAI